MNPEKIRLDFVPHGTNAPDPLPAGQIWLDVGNRSAPRVLDHHGSSREAESASQLLLERYPEYLLAPLADTNEITLVLHQSPDLDAVTAAWLATRALSSETGISDRNLSTIVTAVTENDQGRIKSAEPLRCWPIVMRTLLALTREKQDAEKVHTGFSLLDQTLKDLEQGETLEEIAKKLATPAVIKHLREAKEQYQADLSRARFFQALLPCHQEGSTIEKRLPADGIMLTNPRSSLFKELARDDRKNSPQQQGFPLLVIVKPVMHQDDHTLRRYIISTDPATGFHLRGLGQLLEVLEQEAENRSPRPLLPGRERVPPGTGRFGGDIASPWYDGRGHHYTIVDSPAVTINNQPACASTLTPDEIIKAITSDFRSGSGQRNTGQQPDT